MITPRTHTLAALALALELALVAAPAAAQEGPDALIEQGLALRREGRDEQALELFRRAHRERPTPRALAQVALAEQALGRMIEANEHLDDVLAAEGDPWVARNRAILEDAQRRVRSGLGRLELTGGTPGAEVRVEGAVRGTLPLAAPLWVFAGSLRVDVSAPGHHPFSRVIEVTPGGSSRAAVVLVPLEAGEAESGLSRPSEPRAGDGLGTGDARADGGAPDVGDEPVLIAGLVALGVAVASVGVGAGMHALREDLAGTFNGDGCIAPGQRRGDVCSGELARLGEAEIGMGVGYAVGGAVAVAGAVLVALGVSSGGASEHALGCGAGPGELGLRCGVRF